MIPIRVDPAITPHIARSGFTVADDHPLAAVDCPVCDGPLTWGDVSLVFVGREPGDGWTAASVAVHTVCTGVDEASSASEPGSG